MIKSLVALALQKRKPQSDVFRVKLEIFFLTVL